MKGSILSIAGKFCGHFFVSPNKVNLIILMKYHRHRSAYPYVSGMRNKSIDSSEKNDKLLSDQLL